MASFIVRRMCQYLAKPLMLGVVLTSMFTGKLSAESSNISQAVFISGQDGYDTYRIPALAVSNQGALIAFCEGRKAGQGDAGDIDLLCKRSLDGGVTWSEQITIWDEGDNTCGNPCPIVDRQTKTIFLLMTWNLGSDRESEIIAQTSRDTRKVFVTASRDEGETWSKPSEITSAVKKPDWSWYATGPGAGIVLQRGPHAGRLVAACDHIEVATKKYYSHVIFSDDHGATWQLGGRTPRDQVNECQVAEISQNRLLLNMRSYDRSKKCRQTAISADGGMIWRDQTQDATLVDPICQASLRAADWNTDGTRRYMLFSNPASETQRVNMTLRVSRDEGKTWPYAEVLHEGPAAYSDLAILPNRRVGCLFESGEKHPYEHITFATRDLEEFAK